MVTCPRCQANYPENTVFCNECGFHLLGDNEKSTEPMDVGKVTQIVRTGEVPEEEVTSPLGLRLTIRGSGRDVEVPLTEAVTIGRLDPTVDSFPEVDLSRAKGGQKGVSRRHAKITKRGREVVIEDMGSMNGTFLNGKKLTPYLPEVLRSGDQLQLGELMLWVSFFK